MKSFNMFTLFIIFCCMVLTIIHFNKTIWLNNENNESPGIVRLSKNLVEQMLNNNGKLIGYLFCELGTYVAIEFNQDFDLDQPAKNNVVVWNSYGGGMRSIKNDDIQVPIHISVDKYNERVYMIDKNRIALHMTIGNYGHSDNKFPFLSYEEYIKSIIRSGNQLFNKIAQEGIYVLGNGIYSYPTNDKINERIMELKEWWHAENGEVLLVGSDKHN